MTNKILLSALAAGTLALVANPANADAWSFQIEPYLLGVTIDGDVGIGRVTGADLDLNTSDILDSLDLGGMVRFEARHEDGWGVVLDYAFMDLSDDITGPRGGVLEGEVFQGVFEALFMQGTPSGELDYFLGLRWWDNDVDVVIDPAILPGTISFEQAEDWVDLVVGLRWTQPVSSQWTMHLRGDVGGFGLEADFTSTLEAIFRYALTETIDLDLQYKATWVDFESGSRGTPGYFEYDTVTHGPGLGVNFRF